MTHIKFLILGGGLAVMALAIMLVIALGGGSASANSVSVIDFEGLAEGSIVSSVPSGSGISGDPVSGSVLVN